MIDTHAHIYDSKFDNDRDQVIANAQAVNIQKILMPNCAMETIDAMMECEKKYPDICIPMIGLHPCYVIDNVEEELAVVKQWLEKRNFCAIGEIGLDFYWDITFVEAQKYAYRQQIAWAIKYKLPIVVHSRESTQDCIEIAKEYIAQGLKGVFHCFSGTLEEAHQLVEMGFYLGIGGVLSYKKSGLDVIVKQIDLKHLILETDAPYLAPVPHRGKRNEPTFMSHVAQTLADIKEISLQKVDEITTFNAMQLFNL